MSLITTIGIQKSKNGRHHHQIKGREEKIEGIMRVRSVPHRYQHYRHKIPLVFLGWLPALHRGHRYRGKPKIKE